MLVRFQLSSLAPTLIDAHARTNRFGFRFGVFWGFDDDDLRGSAAVTAAAGALGGVAEAVAEAAARTVAVVEEAAARPAAAEE